MTLSVSAIPIIIGGTVKAKINKGISCPYHCEESAGRIPPLRTKHQAQ